VVEIKLSGDLSADEAALTAAVCLHKALRDVCGLQASIATAPSASGSKSILIEYDGTETDDPSQDGFVIKGGKDGLVVTGRSMRGAVYGIYELEKLIRLRRHAPFAPISMRVIPAFRYRIASVLDDPRFPPFATQFTDPELLLKLGYNGVIVERAVAEVVTLDRYDPGLYPKGSHQREMALARRDYVRERIEQAKQHHLMVFLQGDMVTVPVAACDKYGDAILHEDGICIAKPKTRELLQAMFDEVLELFPQVDGVVVRAGENTASTTGYLYGVKPVNGTCPECRDMEDAQKLATLVGTLAEIIVGRHHKIYAQRTWGYYVSWHTVPEEYLAATDSLTPRPGLYFSMKHTETDYWRYNRINPTIGIGKHPQMVEFQCSREYEGKGAFPLYCGRLFSEGGTEIEPYGGVTCIYDKGVRAVWTWLGGAGLKGPYLKREDWVELNAYALARLLWEPDADPYAIAREWCQLKFNLNPDSPILDRFEAVCRKSEEAVLKARYCRAMVELGKPYQIPPVKYLYGWAPGGAWFRDAYFLTKGLRGSYKFLSTKGGQEAVEAALREKEEARQVYKSLIEDFEAILEQAGPNPDWSELYTTAKYGDYWVKIATYYFVGVVRYDQWLASGKADEAARASAIENLLKWRQSWAMYNDEMSNLPGSASLCRSEGMVELCEEALTDLQSSQSR